LILMGVLAACGQGVRAEGAGALQPTPAPEGAHLYFISPVDGARLTNPVTIRFGLAGMGVAPAGVQNPKAGHHHLIIDAPTPPAGMPIPSDAHHRHFGGGQTEVTLDLPLGTHTLQLVLGDYEHVPFDPPIVSKRITVTVE